MDGAIERVSVDDGCLSQRHSELFVMGMVSFSMVAVSSKSFQRSRRSVELFSITRLRLLCVGTYVLVSPTDKLLESVLSVRNLTSAVSIRRIFLSS